MEVDRRLLHVTGVGERDLSRQVDRRIAAEGVALRMKTEASQFEGKCFEQVEALLRLERNLEADVTSEDAHIGRERYRIQVDANVREEAKQPIGQLTLGRLELGRAGEEEIEVMPVVGLEVHPESGQRKAEARRLAHQRLIATVEMRSRPDKREAPPSLGEAHPDRDGCVADEGWRHAPGATDIRFRDPPAAN